MGWIVVLGAVMFSGWRRPAVRPAKIGGRRLAAARTGSAVAPRVGGAVAGTGLGARFGFPSSAVAGEDRWLCSVYAVAAGRHCGSAALSPAIAW